MISSTGHNLIKKSIEAKLLWGSLLYLFWGIAMHAMHMPLKEPAWERFVMSGLGLILFGLIHFKNLTLDNIYKFYDGFVMAVLVHVFATFWRSADQINYQTGLILTVSVISIIRSSSPYFKYLVIGTGLLTIPTFFILPINLALFISLNLLTVLSLGLLESGNWKNFMKEYVDKNYRLEKIYHSTFEGILLFQGDGAILENNASLAAIFGYQPENLKNKSLDKLFPQGDIEIIKSLYQRESPASAVQLTGFRLGGVVIICEVMIKNITFENAVVGMLLVRDITEQVRSENLLRDQQIKLAQSSKFSALGEMAAGIGHEINNPLSVIQGWAEEMQFAIGNPDKIELEVLKEGTEKILLTTQRISKIVRGLKSLAHQGNQEPFIPYEIRQIIEDTIVLCQEKFKVNQIQFSLEINTSNLVLDCRPHEISQVILNFLGNSIDAIKELPERWIKIHVNDMSEMLEIAIIDSGTGIPAEIKDKIMQPFFTTKELGKGTGLGLSISKSLVESHQGAVWIDSSIKNTKFVLVLPRNQTVSAITPSGKAA